MGQRNSSLRRPALLAVLTAVICLAQARAEPRGVVVDGAGPWRDARWTLAVTEFTHLLTDAGYRVDTVSPLELASAGAAPDVVLAVPSLERLPLASFKAIAGFVASGGSLMASGGEPFRTPLYFANGEWMDRTSLLQTLTPERTVLDPATATLSEMFLTPAPVTRSTVKGAEGQSTALDFQLQIPESGQYYLLSAPLEKPVFRDAQTATIVWTRGTPGQSMLFEWDESDGSRWIATIPLTSQWSKQVLLPGDFHYWPSNLDRAGGVFNPAQAIGMYFGVSSGQGAQAGPLEFAVSAIGVAVPPALDPFAAPLLETLSPAYKQYETQRAGQTVRIPVARGRGLSASPDPDGRYRVVGDLQSPAATWYITNTGAVTIWLPWPQLTDPDRAALVALLRADANRIHILNAGPTQLVVLPTEDVVVGARVLNAASSPAQVNLLWSISDTSGSAVTQFTVALNLASGKALSVPPTDLGRLPPGDYTVTASLATGSGEVDRIETRVRVFDPALSFRPDQRIVVSKGNFSTAAGRRVFLQGVNYWPRNAAGQDPARFAQSWLLPQNYDPALVEADLTLLASLHFNLVSIGYFPYISPEQGRNLADFLDRCRNHGLWANIYIPTFIPGAPLSIAFSGESQVLNPATASLLESAFLPGNDRVFALDLLWEPRLGLHADRMILDNAWRAWIIEQYGSTANAERAWNFTAPRDTQGQLSNPLDSQIQSDGSWRIMVAAYRRFADDFLGRSLGAAVRAVRRTVPGTLISFRNGVAGWTDSNNALMGYDLGTAAAHVDFVSTEAGTLNTWPNGRSEGFAVAYGRYRSGGKPVYWAEYGLNVDMEASPASRARQAANADSMMRMVNEDGSAAASVWWMPGGWRVDSARDYGIVNPDGSPRESAQLIADWGAKFLQQPPSEGSGAPAILTIDRDADARGQYGLFLRWGNDYVQSKLAGLPVVVREEGAGADTATMPLLEVGNAPYATAGPLKYANAEFAGIHVSCPGVDVTAENGAQVPVPAAAACQVTPAVVNTAQATWLAATQSKGGVSLATNLGNLSLPDSLPYLQRTAFGPLQVAAGQTNVDITGKLNIQGVGPFGETLHLTLVRQSVPVDTPVSSIITASLPSAVVGISYSQPLTASSGTVDYLWSIVDGALPPGLALSNNPARIAGTPTTAGSFAFTLGVTNSAGQRATRSFAIAVTGPAVVSGANFQPSLARGAIATVFGSLLSGGDTRVLVNGLPAPLLFVSPAQINFQIPFETPLQHNVSILVERNGVRTFAATAAIVEYAPELYLYQRTPNDLDPIVTHPDGSLVAPANPAVANELLTAYGTGLGGLLNAPPTGAPAPADPRSTSRVTPSITVGGQPAKPIFTGLSPGSVGLALFNFQMPPVLPPGSLLPLTIQFGDVSSHPVNLSVK